MVLTRLEGPGPGWVSTPPLTSLSSITVAQLFLVTGSSSEAFSQSPEAFPQGLEHFEFFLGQVGQFAQDMLNLLSSHIRQSQSARCEEPGTPRQENDPILALQWSMPIMLSHRGEDHRASWLMCWRFEACWRSEFLKHQGQNNTLLCKPFENRLKLH